MPLSAAEQAAIDRLRSYYEGDNPYNSVTNPGGFRQGGHLYNFVPALKDLAVVIVGAARLATEVAANSVQSPKAVRVDSDQAYTDDEKARGRNNLGLGSALADYVKKAGDYMSGNLNIAKTYPAIVYKVVGGANDGNDWATYHHDVDDKFYMQYQPKGGATSSVFTFNKDGAVTTLQFGDLNSRIEARGASYRDAAIAATLPRTGGTLTGAINFLMPNPAIFMKNTDGGTWNNYAWNITHYGPDGNLYFQTIDQVGGGSNQMRFNRDGTLWTSQLGDLSTRIETRASAIADNRLATARSEDALRVAKTGDTMTGQLVIKYNYPGLELRANDPAGFPYIDFTNEAAQNVDYCWRLLTYGRSGDGFSLVGQDGAAKLQVGQNGSVVVGQFGDLNARIEARGLAYQQAAQGTSVQKAGDTMSGDLQINGNSGSASPGVRFVYPSNADWLIRSIGDNQLQFCDGARSIQYFAFSANGAINTRQFGDLNARIEARGSAWADNAVNRSVTSCRWAFVGDLYNSYNLNNGMAEPYGGSAMTGRATYADGTANGAWIPGIFRWRQLQIYIPNQGWVATYFS